jgi:hypothetical protein
MEQELVSPENIQTGGDIVIDEVYISSPAGEFDIRELCLDIEIYEDIFSNTMVGEATIVDAVGLISRLPITGGEIFTIVARTPSFPSDEVFAIKRSFIIYAIEDRVLLKDRQQAYTIKFISPEGFADNQTTLSKTFRGNTDDIVDKIFNDYLKSHRYMRENVVSEMKTPLFIPNRPNKTSVTVVVPSWSPLKTINWIANRAQSSKGNANNFLFFESNKQFYFGSIEDFIEIQRNDGLLMSEYFYSDSAIRDSDSGNFSYSFPNIERSYKTILSIDVPRMFDILRAQDYGYYSGTMLTYDLLLKQYKERTWDYHANFDKYVNQEDYIVSDGKMVTKKGQTQPFSSRVMRSPNTFRAFRPKHYMHHTDYPDNKIEDWALQRNSQLYGLSDIKVEVNVPGRTDAEVGRLVYLHFPIGSVKETNGIEVNFDPYMTGVYMITAIRHHISLIGKHRMSMELIKDSFRKPLQ